MKRGERPFVVGRRTRKGTTVVLLGRGEEPVGRPERAERASPIPGPWTLRAVVTPAAASR